MNELTTITNQLGKLIKPELVLISEKNKLRDYSLEEMKGKTVDLVVYLLSLLGVSEGKTDHHNALVIHIVQNYTHYTFEQITKAFDLFVSGALKVKPFQQLNGVVFGQVMNKFDEYQNEKTKVYRLNIQEFKNKAEAMTESDKDEFMQFAIKKAIQQFKETGIIEIPSAKYDWLDAKGMLQGERTNEEWGKYKKTKYYLVQTRLSVHYKNVKNKSVDHKNELKSIVKELEQEKSGKVITQCKLEILQDYFTNQLKIK